MIFGLTFLVRVNRFQPCSPIWGGFNSRDCRRWPGLSVSSLDSDTKPRSHHSTSGRPDAYDGAPLSMAAYISVCSEGRRGVFALAQTVRDLPESTLDWRLIVAGAGGAFDDIRPIWRPWLR